MTNVADAAAEEAKTLASKTTDEDFVKSWLKELASAYAREKDWRAQGDKLTRIYEAEAGAKATNPYNILFSNTETLSPALYNSTPRPQVKPRFVQKDNALTRLAALTGQRLLQFFIDTNNPDYPDLDEVLKQTLTEALVPGRGVPRVKYEADIQQEQVTSETVCVATVPWDRFLHGYAKHWQQVPWVAYEHRMTFEDAKASFGEEAARSLDFSEDGSSDGSGADGDTDGDSGGRDLFSRKVEGAKGAALAQVFEIWVKASRTVVFISPNAKDKVLKRMDDPLKLQGFFPTPKPLHLIRTISSLTPRALYSMYEQQAQELNDLTVRISKIVKAMKVRGYYNSTVEGLRNLLEQDDNTMLPLTNAGQLQAQGLKLDDAIWLMPIEKLVAVLQQLVTQRAQVKQVIFEITGIADIMRGSSQASETLGAQEIKNQWGTLRLKRLQKEVARYTRDVLRIALEIMVTRFGVDTVKAMTGLPFPTRMEKQQAQAQMQQLQATLPPGAPPEQLPPEMQQIQAVLAAPDMDTVLELLKNDTLRNFAVDVETNSTVDAEATEDKQDMAELMNALAQFLNGVAPLVESGTMPQEAAKVIMLHLLRRFRMGGEVEEAIMAIQPPSPGGGQESAQLEEMKKALEKGQADLQVEIQKLESAKAEFELERKLAQRELEFEKSLAQRELQANQRLAEQSVRAAADAERNRITETFKTAEAAQKRSAMESQAQAQAQAQPAAQPAAPASAPMTFNITIDGKTGAVKRSVKVQRDPEGNLVGADISDDDSNNPQEGTSNA